MGFATSGRLILHITPSDVGKRVSVRALTEAAEEAGRFTDTVGVLTSWDAGVLHITRKSGEAVRILESSLVAGKIVPPAPARGRGPAASYRELAPVIARSWQPVESEQLGGWQLRAAAGFTRRANSVLPLADPGIPLDEALSRVVGWYGERGLPAYVQTAFGAEDAQELLAADLGRRGWQISATAEVRIGRLAPVGDLDADVSRVRLTREVDASWLARYHRSGGTPGAAELSVLGSGPSVWFATVFDEPGTDSGAGAGAGAGSEGSGTGAAPGASGTAPAAIGRCVVDGRWAGFMAIEVDPARRREGLATAVMTALARQALDEGASASWLQVESDNSGARALYDGMGFAAHHGYHHYRAPEPEARG